MVQAIERSFETLSPAETDPAPRLSHAVGSGADDAEVVDTVTGGLAPGGTAPRPRVGIVTFFSGRFDSRTYRIARGLVTAGYPLRVYARAWEGLPLESDEGGFRVLRVPLEPRVVLPGLDVMARRHPSPSRRPRGFIERLQWLAWAPWRRLTRPPKSMRGTWLRFPREVKPWAIDLDRVVEPADIWIARSTAALPVALRQAKRLGGRVIYDASEVYVQSGRLARGGWYPRILGMVERRWAHRADAVITNSEGYADLLVKQLRVPRPLVLLNGSERAAVADAHAPRPDLIRERLGLPATTRVVLYQGGLMAERGIEQSMDAILQVPDAVLVLMGMGGLRETFAERTTEARYTGRVFVIEAVVPSELLRWTASADVMVIAIQPTTPNHVHSTPNKLFEALSAGTPVVASDLPGMASIVRQTDFGVLVDATSPDAIATGIRRLLDEPADAKAARRGRGLDAARSLYDWETQMARLLELCQSLATRGRERG